MPLKKEQLYVTQKVEEWRETYIHGDLNLLLCYYEISLSNRRSIHLEKECNVDWDKNYMSKEKLI